MALVNRFLEGTSWTEAWVTGSVVGVVFGAVTGPVSARDNRRVIEAAGYLPPGRLGRAVRPARRGRVPEDPELRRAARRIAQHHLSQQRSHRLWALPVVVLLTVLSLWLALDGGEAAGLGWLGAVCSLALLAATCSWRVTWPVARSCSPTRRPDRTANPTGRTPRCVHTRPPGMLLR